MNDVAQFHDLHAEQRSEGEQVEKAKILLVDDEPKSLFALQELLSTLGQPDGGAAAGGAPASRLDNDFAVILLDVRMPGSMASRPRA